jgi:hypothetical protein
MSIDAMNSLRIEISLSDPWDLGESLKWQPILGQMALGAEHPSHGRVLVTLDQPIEFGGSMYRYAVAAPRHEGRRVAEVADGRSVLCSFIGITDEQAKSPDRTSIEGWRGGLSFIGELRAAT